MKQFLSCYEDTHGDTYVYIHIHIKNNFVSSFHHQLLYFLISRILIYGTHL